MADDTSPVECLECGAMFVRPRRKGGQPAVVCSEACRADRKKLLDAGYARNQEAANARSRRYRATHREEILERRRRWRAANRDLIAERALRYRTENREDVALRVAKWRLDNPERIADRSRQWREENPEAVRIHQQRRRAAKRDALVHDVPDEMAWEFNPAGPGCCNYCDASLEFGDRRSWHIDHVVPLSRGGLHELHNLVIACVACNCSKGAKLLSEWRPRAA